MRSIVSTDRKRSLLFLLFVVMVVYCYGAGMMDYFAIYQPWQLIGADEFTALQQFQGNRVVNIFVIPSAIMTVLNILVLVFPASFVNRKLVLFSLIAYAFDWIFSFTMQIPIQLRLSEGKDMELLNELLKTNWWRFGADTAQFIIVCILFWQALSRTAPKTGRSVLLTESER